MAAPGKMCVPVKSSNVRSNAVSLTAGGPESDNVTTVPTGVPRVTVRRPISAMAHTARTTRTRLMRLILDMTVGASNTERAMPRLVLVAASELRQLSSMFEQSTILLTGVGGEGQVGEAVAAAFAELGASVVLVDHSDEKVQARTRALTDRGKRAAGFACDLADPAAVTALADRVRENHGAELRGLVHLAGGFAMSGPVAESSVEVWNKQITINLTTAFLTARAFLPMLRAGKGSVVFFASQAAMPGSSGKEMSAYAVAKGGVVSLMRAIAAEEKASGVRANAVAPTSIRTAANMGAMGNDVKYVEREEVARVVTFLCSNAANAITGALIPLS
jgi:NAD(P)-dependent dehydrogenase (short-subunit alcohol dehydrogenase family)